MNSKQLRKNIDATFDHTKKVLENLISFIYNRKSFNKAQKVKTSLVRISKPAKQSLPLLAFIHDLYKILNPNDHAQLGANFISDDMIVNLVRFHDVFGVIDTGEASLLFLDELVQFVKTNKKKRDINEFLNKLQILTIVDIAAYGFSNQSRIKNFRYFITLINKLPSKSKFNKLAIDDTTNRITRLLKANNRIEIDNRLVSKAMRKYKKRNRDILKEKLVTARFDAGAYVLEPMFRTFISHSKKYLMSNKTVIKIKNNSRSLASIHRFFDCLLKILSGESSPPIIIKPIKIGTRNLKIYDMNSISIKNSQNINKFLKWVEKISKLKLQHLRIK